MTCDVVSLTGSEVVAVYYPPLRTRDPDLRAILEIHGSDLYGGQACWAPGAHTPTWQEPGGMPPRYRYQPRYRPGRYGVERYRKVS